MHSVPGKYIRQKGLLTRSDAWESEQFVVGAKVKISGRFDRPLNLHPVRHDMYENNMC
jgi:hypothetical protein